MLVKNSLSFIRIFIEQLDSSLKYLDPSYGLSRKQKVWLSFCLLGLIVTNSLNWKQFERSSGGSYSNSALSKMFRRSKHFWDHLLRASVRVILRKYGITEGIIALDDTDNKRSKTTKKIYKSHKTKDKSTGGYFNGQSMVFLVLVTSVVTIPVGFEFYMPDPVLQAWKKKDDKLKKQGVAKDKRPKEPQRDKNYPTKQKIALTLLQQFRNHFSQIKIKCILADGLYGDANFVDKASGIFDNIQVISKIRKSQNIRFRGKKTTIKEYFRKRPGAKYQIKIRGGEEKIVTVCSARLYVCSHKKKRFIVAFKYEGDDDYRYLVACDLSWRTLDIIQAYTIRWLVEVFFQDWKMYEGWGQLAKQPDEEGSRRGLILSLLLDHCLLFHPEQSVRLENNLPACTVGSLRETIRAESLFEFIKELIQSENPEKRLEDVMKNFQEVCKLNISSKHMVNRDLGRLEPSKSLKYRAAQVVNYK